MKNHRSHRISVNVWLECTKVTRYNIMYIQCISTALCQCYYIGLTTSATNRQYEIEATTTFYCSRKYRITPSSWAISVSSDFEISNRNQLCPREPNPIYFTPRCLHTTVSIMNDSSVINILLLAAGCLWAFLD